MSQDPSPIARALARVALAEYDVDVRRLRVLPMATNIIIRVDTSTAPLALRIGSPRWRDLSDLEAEAAWLTALGQDTSLAVPVPVPARSGGLVVPFDHEGAFHATLMTWLPGRLLGRSLTVPNLRKMGELFATLHAHGRDWSPPATFSAKRFDRVLSRSEPNVWQSVAEAAGASTDDVAVIRDVHDRVDTAYASLDPLDLRVIHGDLHHDNIKTHAGLLCPFDFEDTVRGYRIHDIAMAMLDLWDVVDPVTYDRLLDAFHDGYTRTTSWPTDDLTLFQLGRYVWRLNWVAWRRPAEIVAAVEATAQAFRHTSETGRLQPAA
jgi:Ser/Thr protein kinase RdoA (MazF antagonist)